MDDRAFWNEAYQEDADQVMVVDRILDDALENLSVGTALDLGCGIGTNALKLAAKGWSVVGIDWAERAIELASEAAKQRGLDARFVVDDITSWRPETQFDLVVSTYALPGGEGSRRTLRTAAEALRPGGTLIVAEWDRSMTQAWGFGEDDLMTPQQIAASLPGLAIERAEVREVQDVFASPDGSQGQAGSSANVAFVRARKP
jgi:2-polyprenyl-3-methyl-5-hydroxy-6-metoxy-1,4-benzoquinol methylase